MHINTEGVLCLGRLKVSNNYALSAALFDLNGVLVRNSIRSLS